MTTSQPSPVRPRAPRPAAGRLLAHLPAAGGPAAAAQPADRDLHPGHAAGASSSPSAPGTTPRPPAGATSTAYIMISLAVYGAMIATTGGGAHGRPRAGGGLVPPAAADPAEPGGLRRGQGAHRDGPRGAVGGIIFAVGAVGGARMAGWVWVASALIAWVGALVFAAFGLFMGYLLPSENVMQILGPVLALLAFFGGLFVPLSVLGPTFQQIATFTPAYGVGVLARRAPDRRPGQRRGDRQRRRSGRRSSSPVRSGGSAATPPGSDGESHCSP